MITYEKRRFRIKYLAKILAKKLEHKPGSKAFGKNQMAHLKYSYVIS